MTIKKVMQKARFIKNFSDLAMFKQELTLFLQKSKNKHAYIALDMEFFRHHHHIPEIALLQLRFEQKTVIIDAPKLKKHLRSLFRQLALCPTIDMIWHAPEQDLSIFYHYAGIMPHNIIDTQLAERFLSNSPAGGYAGLVKNYKNIDIDKSKQFQDWLKRPLSDQCLDYAAIDVEYLEDIFNVQKKQLLKDNKYEDYKSALALFLDKTTRQYTPSTLKDLGVPKAAHKLLQTLLNQAYYKRFVMAQNMNISPSRILSNDALHHLCFMPPVPDGKNNHKGKNYWKKLKKPSLLKNPYHAHDFAVFFQKADEHIQSLSLIHKNMHRYTKRQSQQKERQTQKKKENLKDMPPLARHIVYRTRFLSNEQRTLQKQMGRQIADIAKQHAMDPTLICTRDRIEKAIRRNIIHIRDIYTKDAWQYKYLMS